MSRHPIISLLQKRRLRVLGINSGTSIDGLDGAMVEISELRPHPRYRVIQTMSRKFPTPVQRELRHLAGSEELGKERAAAAHFALGDFIARSAQSWIRRFGRVDLVASHGQTIAHYPNARTRSTWQIGSLNLIAQSTRCVTIGDFRPADIAAGGMGAPLSGYYHHLIFGTGVPVLNLGGIANVSVSYKRNGRLCVAAFDTGPGNMLLDAICQQYLKRAYDRDGVMASRGRVNDALLTRLLRLSYFKRRPPKTCGREEFGWDTIGHLLSPRANPMDLLATATALTARSIAHAVERWIAPWTRSRTIVLSGGGISNQMLLRLLGELLPRWRLAPAEDWGVPARYLEPVGFAVLAHETLHHRPGNLGAATGARSPAVLGMIALPPRDA